MSWLELSRNLGTRVAHAGGPVARIAFERAGLEGAVLGHPIMVRAGLGHMLGAWARCVVWSKKHHVRMLAPQWFHLRVGPYLRREPDKRAYHRLFHSEGYVDGFPRALCLAFARRIGESHAADAWSSPPTTEPTLVVFHEDHGLDCVRDEHPVLLAELLRITRRRYVDQAIIDDPFIGVHVRRGDFSSASTETELRTGRKNLRTPVEWYATALTALRRALGEDKPARLFSDGTLDELRPLLGLPAVELMPTRSAITDILTLSQARVVLASGSGFSQWACFLGQMPTLWFPGQHHFRLRTGAEGADLEVEWEADTPMPDRLVSAVASGWRFGSYLREHAASAAAR